MWAREIAGEERRQGAALHVAALHAVEPAVAEDLLAEVGRRFQPTTAFVGSFSPVMVAHTGPRTGRAGLVVGADSGAAPERAASPDRVPTAEAAVRALRLRRRFK